MSRGVLVDRICFHVLASSIEYSYPMIVDPPSLAGGMKPIRNDRFPGVTDVIVAADGRLGDGTATTGSEGSLVPNSLTARTRTEY